MITVKRCQQACLSLLLFTLLLSVACEEGNDIENCDEHNTEQCRTRSEKNNIRIKNISDYDYCNVKVNHGGQKVNYGIVEKGETTCYRPTDTTYSFAFVFVKIRGLLFKDNAIKYSGKIPLAPGKYTYKVDVLNFEREQLEVTAVKN